jgi:uncharacterized protein YvpB
MKLQVPVFGQRDSRWANKLLGTSTSTIGGYGCLITSIAMLAKYYGKDTDPDRMNTSLISVGGYASGNLYKWYEGVTKIYPDITCTKIVYTPDPLSTAQETELKNEIDAGRPVVLYVDFNPATAAPDMHFVLLIGYEGDTFYMNDPWYGDTANLTRYGDHHVTINQYVFHKGTVPTASSDTIPVLKTDFERLVTKATELDNQNPKYAELKQIVQEINNQLDGTSKERDALKEFVQKLGTMLNCTAATETIMGKITEILSVEDDLSSCRKSESSLQETVRTQTTTIETKEAERKEAVGQLLIASNTIIVQTGQIKTLTTDRDTWKSKYDVLSKTIGSLAQFTKKEMFNYLFTNWFNSKAFRKA